MEYQIEEIEGLEVEIEFIDGCFIKLKVVSTGHLRDGGDIVAEILETNCSDISHNHQSIGSIINIKIEEIKNIKNDTGKLIYERK